MRRWDLGRLSDAHCCSKPPLAHLRVQVRKGISGRDMPGFGLAQGSSFSASSGKLLTDATSAESHRACWGGQKEAVCLGTQMPG